MSRFPIFLTALAFGVSACATSPVDEEARARAETATPLIAAEWQAAAESVRGEPIGWIEQFNDPTLVALVKEAQENNQDLAAAAANVERARALARQAGAALSPDLDLSAGSDTSGILDGGDSSNLSLGLQVDWELDVWGRLRAGEAAAIAGFEAAQADFRFAQYSLAANVANAYLLSIEAIRQEEITQGTVDALAETARIVGVRFDNGMSSSQDRALARAELATAADALEEVQGAKRDAFRALELLLGRYPSADVDLKNTLPALPDAPPAGLPSELLERRPDLISAERQIASAIGSLESAKAAKLPRLSLTTTIGGSSDDLSNILDPENVAWSLISNLVVPLLDGGRLDSEIDIESADLDEAVANYVQAALTAFSEVETALDQSTVLARREANLKVAVKESEEALRIARVSYQEGETDLIDVLSIQQTVNDAQSGLLSVERAMRETYIDLNLALGGDWQSADLQ